MRAQARRARPRRRRRAHPLRLHERGHQQPLLRAHHRAPPCATSGCRGFRAVIDAPARARRRAARSRRCSPTPTASPPPRPRSARSSPSSSTASSASTRIEAVEFLGKFSGATGTFAAHVAADPDADWPAISREFVDHLGLTWNPLTTQIESHDWQAELFGRISHANRILHNLCTDVWTYISMGYFTQIPQAGRHRLVDDAAQDQPDPLRERRGQPRARRAPCSTRSPRPSSRAACSATSPTRRRSATSVSRSATRCSRSTTSTRGLGEIAVDPDGARRRPRRQLGGARRGHPDGHPRRGHRRPLVDRRPLRAAQGAHPRQARRRRPSWSRSSTALDIGDDAKARLRRAHPGHLHGRSRRGSSTTWAERIPPPIASSWSAGASASSAGARAGAGGERRMRRELLLPPHDSNSARVSYARVDTASASRSSCFAR